MYTATVLLQIELFVPMTGIYGQSPSIKAIISPPKNTSPVPAPNVFSGDGQSITITVPKGYPGSVQLTYQLPNPKYVLLGVAFKSPNGGLGRLEFRTISIDRDPFGSQMTVTDACAHQCDGVLFDYVLLVQEIGTGNIGLIDPGIETDSEE